MRGDALWVSACRRIVISGRQTALEHGVGCACRWNLTVLYLDVVIGVLRRGDSFMVGGSLATHFWSICCFLIHWLSFDDHATRLRLTCSDVIIMLMLNICDVWHVLGHIRVHVDLLLLLGARRQKGLWRILSNDDIFLDSSIVCMFLHLKLLRLADALP